MDITHLTPDAEGSIEWPSFSNDKKAVVTLGAFDGMHLGHQAVIKRVVEAYCITEEWIDLYDHKVRVEFVGFLRPQVKFDGPDQLVDELKRNVEETKRLTA